MVTRECLISRAPSVIRMSASFRAAQSLLRPQVKLIGFVDTEKKKIYQIVGEPEPTSIAAASPSVP